MAAAGALSVVKQIQALAEGPKTPEMRECLGQVVSSLLFFLDHPDSRVRLSAARTLLKLSTGYPEDVQNLDLGRARSSLARCRQASAEGTADADNEELQKLLAAMLEEGASSQPAATGAAEAVAAPADRAEGEKAAEEQPQQPPTASEERGQVVLRVVEDEGEKVAKATMLERVVKLAGVVSVTFEGSFVIVATKTAAVAKDSGFLADLLAAARVPGLEGVALASSTAATTGAPSAASSDTAAPPAPAVVVEEEEEEAEPAYLDDDEDEADAATTVTGPNNGMAGGSLAGGAPQWSFFSQSNWMTGRRLQEFGDDPTIAARLARAKKKEEEKREEERSRMGRISSWLMGGR